VHVLIVGGTRFVGYLLTWRLLARGDRVTLFNRGRLPDPFGDRVDRLHGDRTTADFARLVRGRAFDAAVDFAAYTDRDTQSAVEVLAGRAGHYVFVSTGQVYLVRQDCPRPSREADYDGPLVPEPADPRDRDEWAYGVDKRAAEDALAAAWTARHFPATRLRLPMVNGERDHFRRIESYLWRVLDGGPVILPDGGPRTLKHVYGADVAGLIAGILGNAATHGKVYNLAQDDAPTLAELVGRLAALTGALPRTVAVSTPALSAAGLPPHEISPFDDPWMSSLDASAARTELGFRPESTATYLPKIVAAFLAAPPAAPPDNYRYRPAERAFAAGLRDAPRAP
jgi:nucleoside-diphosphate-sugar epimerase